MPDTNQLFRTVRIGRASGDIVDQIKEQIFEGRFAPGDRLPSEKELIEQFGVSRTTVREAMHVLESQGLVDIKVGAGGGAFVAVPSADPVNQVMSDLLRMHALSIRELVEARTVIETSIVTFASGRATPEDIKAMQDAIDEARAARAAGNLRFTPFSVRFHIALAAAAKNKVLLFTVNSFRTPFYQTLEKLLPDERMEDQAIEDHQRLLDAIVAHDAEKACQIMSEHLSYFEERAEKLDQTPRGGAYGEST